MYTLVVSNVSILRFIYYQKELGDLYGDVTYVNLLSAGKGGESKLSRALDATIKEWTVKTHSLKSSESPSITSASSSSGEIPAGRSRVESYNRRDAPSSQSESKEYSNHSVRHVMWDFHQQVSQAEQHSSIELEILSNSTKLD